MRAELRRRASLSDFVCSGWGRCCHVVADHNPPDAPCKSNGVRTRFGLQGDRKGGLSANYHMTNFHSVENMTSQQQTVLRPESAIVISSRCGTQRLARPQMTLAELLHCFSIWCQLVSMPDDR